MGLRRAGRPFVIQITLATQRVEKASLSQSGSFENTRTHFCRTIDVPRLVTMPRLRSMLSSPSDFLSISTTEGAFRHGVKGINIRIVRHRPVMLSEASVLNVAQLAKHLSNLLTQRRTHLFPLIRPLRYTCQQSLLPPHLLLLLKCITQLPHCPIHP